MPLNLVQSGWMCFVERVSYSAIKHAAIRPSSKPSVYVFMIVETNLVTLR